MLLLFFYLYSTKSGVQASAVAIKEFANADLVTLKNEGLPHNENIMQSCGRQEGHFPEIIVRTVVWEKMQN